MMPEEFAVPILQNKLKEAQELYKKESFERMKLQDEVERLRPSGVHTCHDDCQNAWCKLRRERDELKREVEMRKSADADSFLEAECMMAELGEAQSKLAVAVEALERASNESSWPFVKKILFEALAKIRGEK